MASTVKIMRQVARQSGIILLIGGLLETGGIKGGNKGDFFIFIFAYTGENHDACNK